MITKEHIPTIAISLAILGYFLHYTETIDLNSDILDSGFPIAFAFIFVLGVCLFIYVKNLREIPKQEKKVFYPQQPEFKKPVQQPKNYLEQRPKKKEEVKDMFEDFK